MRDRAVRVYDRAVYVGLHRAVSGGSFRRCGWTGQCELCRAVCGRVRVCDRIDERDMEPVSCWALQRGRVCGVHGLCGRSVRQWTGAGQLCVYRPVQCRVRVSRRIHQRNGSAVRRGQVLCWGIGDVFGLSRWRVRVDCRSDISRLHSAVSLGSVWSGGGLVDVGVLRQLQRGISLSGGIHHQHGSSLCCGAVERARVECV